MYATAHSLCCAVAKDTILCSSYTPGKIKSMKKQRRGGEERGREGRGRKERREGGDGARWRVGGEEGRRETVTSLPKDSISPSVKWEYYPHIRLVVRIEGIPSVKQQYRAGAPKYQRAEGPAQLTPSSY